MKSIGDIVRAWKDPEYRKTLSKEELAALPPSPAGSSELSDEELTRVAGGAITGDGCSIFYCPPPVTKDYPTLCGSGTPKVKL